MANTTTPITNIESLCQCVGCTLDEQNWAQSRVEVMLEMLKAWNVIPSYNADRLDWMFSNEECN